MGSGWARPSIMSGAASATIMIQLSFLSWDLRVLLIHRAAITPSPRKDRIV
jgi:hypothetical protein